MTSGTGIFVSPFDVWDEAWIKYGPGYRAGWFGLLTLHDDAIAMMETPRCFVWLDHPPYTVIDPRFHEARHPPPPPNERIGLTEWLRRQEARTAS